MPAPTDRDVRFTAAPTSAAEDAAGGDLECDRSHNSGKLMLDIEVRMFNRIHALFGDGRHRHPLCVPAGTSVGDILEQCGIPETEVFLAFVNGRDISLAPGELRRGFRVEDGDIVAFSGAIPYSWGYGAPVV